MSYADWCHDVDGGYAERERDYMLYCMHDLETCDCQECEKYREDLEEQDSTADDDSLFETEEGE